MTITVPGLTDDEQRTLDQLVAQLEAKALRNILRASYYDGKRAIQQIGTIIPPIYYHLGVVLGWSAKAVDILNRRCNLDAFVWPDGDLDSIGYQDVWEDNHLATETDSAGVSSLIHGVSFLVATKGDPTQDEPTALTHVKDALSATGKWNARSRRLDALLSITERTDGQATSIGLYLPDETIIMDKGPYRWAITDRQPHPWGVPAEPLVYKPRVGRPFGSSRISRPVMSLHDQALRTVIRMEANADVYSFPQLWMLGADESLFKNPDGTVKAAWQLMLGRVLGIPDDDEATHPRAEIKQFDASSPAPHIDQLKQQAQLFSGETSIPLTSLGVSDMTNPTSADSYIASREDLIAEAEGVTDDWSTPWRRHMIRLLAIANGLDQIPPAWKTINTKWRSPIYLSRAAAADAGAKQLGAVEWLKETEVGLELLGLDDQQIKRAMSERRRAEGRNVLATLRQAAAAVTDADAD